MEKEDETQKILREIEDIIATAEMLIENLYQISAVLARKIDNDTLAERDNSND